MSSKRCPNCGLYNSDVALWCDCGYDFASGQIRKTNIGNRAESEHPAHEESIRLLDSPVHCYTVIEDVITAIDDSSWGVGDLYVTSIGLVSVLYAKAKFQFVGEGIQKIAGFLGGVVGELPGELVGQFIGQDLSADTNKSIIAEARAKAREERLEDYGLTMKDRVRKRTGFVIQRNQIQSVEAEVLPDTALGGLRIAHVGGTLELIVENAEAQNQKIHHWLEGVLQDEPDKHGVNLPYLTPSSLLKELENIDTQVSTKLVQAIATNKTYMDNLFELFERNSQSKQGAIAKTIGNFPNAFVSEFRGRLGRTRMWAGLSLGVFLVALILGIVAWLSTAGYVAEAIGVNAAIPVVLLGFILAIREWSNKHDFTKGLAWIAYGFSVVFILVGGIGLFIVMTIPIIASVLKVVHYSRLMSLVMRR